MFEVIKKFFKKKETIKKEEEPLVLKEEIKEIKTENKNLLGS